MPTHARTRRAASAAPSLVDPAAELAVLGSLVREPDRFHDPRIARDLFLAPPHPLVFDRLAAAAYAERLGGDLATATAALEGTTLAAPATFIATAVCAAEEIVPEPLLLRLVHLAWRRKVREAATALLAIADQPMGAADDRESLVTLGAQVLALAPGAAPTAATLAAATSALELVMEPAASVAWLVDGLLARGGLSLLVAKPKVGKSTLARCLAAAIALGMPVLDRPTIAGPVLYIALEDRRDDVRDHVAQLLPPGATIPLYFAIGPPAPSDRIGWLRAHIAAHHPSVIILDPIGRFLDVKDLNDYAQVTKATAPLIALARDTDTHLLSLHHAGKNPERAGIDSSLGSTALTGFVDTILIERRYPDGLRTLESVQRVGRDLPETVLELAQTGQLRLCGDVLGTRLAQLADQIVEVVAGGPRTESELRDCLERDRFLVSRALRQALRENRLARIGAGRKGDPYRYGPPGMQPPQGGLFEH